MEPITIIITALALGAAAGLKPTAEEAVKDTYAGIKSLLLRKYSQINLDILETDPSSKDRQAMIKDDLEQLEAHKDDELLIQAMNLLMKVQKYDPLVANTIGVDLNDIIGASLNIEDIRASGTGVRVNKAEVSGDIVIKSVRAGKEEAK